MAVTRASESPAEGMAKTTEVIFIVVGCTIGSIILLLVSCLVLRARKMRRSRRKLNPDGLGLMELKLTPSALNKIRYQSPIKNRWNTSFRGPRKSTVGASQPGPRGRRSRIGSIPSRSRKSTFRLRSSNSGPVRTHEIPRPPRSALSISPRSTLSNKHSSEHDLNSPISPLLSPWFEGRLAIPKPTYQARQRDDGRPRASSILFDHDLVAAQERGSHHGDVDVQPGKSDFGAERLSNTRMKRGRSKQGGLSRERAQMDMEWMEARMETVDGVLAPREWV